MISIGSDGALVLATGRHGSIGRSLPLHIGALLTRLEDTEANMAAELKSFRSPKAMIHLAAVTNIEECEKDPDLAFEMNVNGALRWLRAAAQAGLKKFVYVSSSHVFQPRNELIRFKPSDSVNAISVYGRTKVEAEKTLASESIRLGIELSIARVFSVIAAPGGKLRKGYLQSELQRRAAERDFSPVIGYKNVRDFIATDSIAGALVDLAQTSAPVIAAHICTGRGKTVRELAEQVFSEVGIPRDQLTPMFPDNNDRANYLVGEPTILKGLK